MAPHSSTLAWNIPWTEEPGGLQSMGSLRVGHNWASSLSLFTFMHWRRKWQPTPVFLPGESQGQWSLVGCCLWVRTESDMTEVREPRYYNYKLLVIWQIIICHTTSVTGLRTFVHTHSCFYFFIKLRIIYWPLHVLINYDIDIHVIMIPNSFNPSP